MREQITFNLDTSSAEEIRRMARAERLPIAEIARRVVEAGLAAMDAERNKVLG